MKNLNSCRCNLYCLCSTSYAVTFIAMFSGQCPPSRLKAKKEVTCNDMIVVLVCLNSMNILSSDILPTVVLYEYWTYKQEKHMGVSYFFTLYLTLVEGTRLLSITSVCFLLKGY